MSTSITYNKGTSIRHSLPNNSSIWTHHQESRRRKRRLSRRLTASAQSLPFVLEAFPIVSSQISQNRLDCMYLCGKCSGSFTASEEPKAIVLCRDMQRSTIISSTNSEDENNNEAHESEVEDEIGYSTAMATSDSNGSAFQGVLSK